MRKYLSTLHTRSESHKKRFAFLVSGGLTLVIFTLWTLATFGTGGTLAQNDREPLTGSRPQEVSPFASLKNGLASGWAGFQEVFEGLKGGFRGGNDSQAELEQLRNDVLNIYGGPVQNSR